MEEEPASVQELLGILTAMSAIRRHQNDFVFRLTLSLRRRGVAWEDIAEALGVTRQAASAKHSAEVRRRQRDGQ